jgi:hypothetical protein
MRFSLAQPDADDCRKQLTTPQATPSSTVHFNFSHRFVLALPTLDGAHLRTRLCTRSVDGTAVTVLATSQIRLARLPADTARSFTFPLLCVANTAVGFAIVSGTASLTGMTVAPEEVAPAHNARPRPWIPRRIPAAWADATAVGAGDIRALGTTEVSVLAAADV